MRVALACILFVVIAEAVFVGLFTSSISMKTPAPVADTPAASSTEDASDATEGSTDEPDEGADEHDLQMMAALMLGMRLVSVLLAGLAAAPVARGQWRAVCVIGSVLVVLSDVIQTLTSGGHETLIAFAVGSAILTWPTAALAGRITGRHQADATPPTEQLP